MVPEQYFLTIQTPWFDSLSVIHSHEMPHMIQPKWYLLKEKSMDHGPNQGVSQPLCLAI